MHAYTLTHTHIRTHTHTHACTRTHAHNDTHKHTHTHARMHTRTPRHAHIHTRTHAQTRSRTHAYTRTHTHARTHKHTRTQKLTQTHAHTHTHRHTHTRTHTHAQTHAHTRTLTHTHTHTHTHTNTHTHTYTHTHARTHGKYTLAVLLGKHYPVITHFRSRFVRRCCQFLQQMQQLGLLTLVKWSLHFPTNSLICDTHLTTVITKQLLIGIILWTTSSQAHQDNTTDKLPALLFHLSVVSLIMVQLKETTLSIKVIIIVCIKHFTTKRCCNKLSSPNLRYILRNATYVRCHVYE